MEGKASPLVFGIDPTLFLEFEDAGVEDEAAPDAVPALSAEARAQVLGESAEVPLVHLDNWKRKGLDIVICN